MIRKTHFSSTLERRSRGKHTHERTVWYSWARAASDALHSQCVAAFAKAKKAANASRRNSLTPHAAQQLRRCTIAEWSSARCLPRFLNRAQSVPRSLSSRASRSAVCWSTTESMRGMLMGWRGGAPIALLWCSWWCRRASCRAGLRTPAYVSSSSCADTALGSR